MPFRCKICELDILPGARMVSNERDEVAHETCVRPVVNVIAHTVTKVPSPAAPEPCVPVVYVPDACAECGDHCIAICPYCGKRVCPTYGWNGKTCSVAHEGKCAGARESREPLKKVRPPAAMKPNGPIFDTDPIGNGRNGRHKAKPKGRSRR